MKNSDVINVISQTLTASNNDNLTTPIPNVFMRIYARNSQNNDPITNPKVEGRIFILSSEDGSPLPLLENGTISMDAPTVFLNNKAFIDIGPIPRGGIYQVEFWRSGYLNKTQNLTVEITEPNQRIDKYVIMSPELTPGIPQKQT